MQKTFLPIFFFLSFFFPATVFAHSQTQVVEITSAGFQPDKITVDESSTIIFINHDRVPHWPASDFHPTHDIYPEFDPKKPVEPGESWAFKPIRVGTWRYHDHLFPHIRGTLTVTGEKEQQTQNTNIKDEKKFDVTEKLKNFIINLIDVVKNILKPNSKKIYTPPSPETFITLSSESQITTLKNLAKNSSGKNAWQYVKKVFSGKSGSSGNIHDLAHLAGGLLYDTEGFGGIQNCTSEFAFGCFHGFLDKAFVKTLEHLTDAHDACLKLGGSSQTVSGPVASCIHGIGHGIASFYGTKDLQQSLSSCRRLTSGQEYCFDGVFMEFVRSAPDEFFRKDDLLYPCNALETEFGYAYSFACGRNQPSLLMGRFHMEFDDVISVCQSSESTPFKQACFDSLGFSLAATADVEKIVDGCQKIDLEEFVTRCINAAAGELVFQDVPGWEAKSEAVCNANNRNKDTCLKHVNELIVQYNRQKKINFAPIQNSEDENAYIKKQLGICFNINGRDGCYNQVAKVLFGQFGLAKTLQLLKDNEQHQEIYSRCHEVTHYLSRLEYEKQKNVAKVYSQCDSTCHGGCYHGTMEAFLKEKQDQLGTNLNQEFAKVCGNPKDYQKPLEFNECLHGMGHAAMFINEMELIKSLKLCDLFDKQDQKDRCYTGVFMENSSSSTSFDHTSLYIKADDPFYPCNVLEEKYLPFCWQYQSSYFSIISNQDWEKVASLCLQIPQQYWDRCFRTIGTNQVGFTRSFQVMKDDCDMMPSSHFQDVCVAGVISSLSYRFVGYTKKMIDFCSIVDNQHKETCFKQMGTALLDWNTSKELARRECDKIPDANGASWCMNAI